MPVNEQVFPTSTWVPGETEPIESSKSSLMFTGRKRRETFCRAPERQSPMSLIFLTSDNEVEYST